MTEKIYVSSNEAAEILQLSVRRVVGLCNENAFKGAIKQGRNWKIPKESVISFKEIELNEKSNNNLLSCAVGNTSFADIVKNSYYVDKTLLIRDLIDDQVPVMLFTRPRRFGKTLTLDMIKTYFEKTDINTSVLFKKLKIWGLDEKYRKYQGKYPVISISFKDAKFDNWENTFISIKNIIKDEFLRHNELFTSNSLNPVEKEYLNKLLQDRLNEVDYTRSLLNLERMLEKHYKSKVIVLIDEYDTPILQGYSKNFYYEVINFMRNFMSGGLKDSQFLEFAVLTGILRISKENLFSGLNNPVINSVLEDKYSQYFGFTKEEVDAMANYYGKTEKIEELKEWYDGYCFGNTEIYNPWSVTNYFYNNCVPRPYWTNTGDNEIIKEIMNYLTPEIADKLLILMKGDKIQASLNMNVIYPEISKGESDIIFSFLLVAGYLKPVGEVIETGFGTFADLTIPNKEIQRVYNTEIISWLGKSVNGNILIEIEKALLVNDPNKLKTVLEKFMLSVISGFDYSAEGFYHGMMLGLVAGMSSKYYFHSNREAGAGRFDLLMESKTRILPSIIMEFKYVKDDSELLDIAKEALNQISDKKYDFEIKEKDNSIIKYGIGFSGKKAEIAVSY